MAGSRAELEELRRLDALESRAGATKKPAMPEPAFEREARDIVSTTPAELISANPIVRVATSAARPFLGAAALMEKPFGGHGNADRLKQLDEMQAKGARALGFSTGATMAQDVAGDVLSPVMGAAAKVPAAASRLGRIAQGAGFGGVAGMTTDPDRPISSGAKGAALGAGISGALEAPLAIAGRSVKKPAGRPGPVGEGAEKVTKELQRQRDVIEGKKGVPEGKSQYEREAKDFEERMRVQREAAFREGTPVEAQGAIDTIRQLEAKNPDAKVRAALKEVRQTIARAAEAHRTANLPAAGARLTPQQFAKMQGQGTQFDVAMADEVRQSINRMIEGKGEGALDAHTKEVLGQVRDRLMASTPESYRKYVADYAKGAEGLRTFSPEHGPTGKLTSAERGAQAPSGIDAQKAMNSVLGGQTPARDIAKLVRDTKHDPEVVKGLRKSVSDWLIQKDAMGDIKANEMLTRWRDSRQAIQESEMFDPKHFDSIDKLMTQLQEAHNQTGVKKAVGNMVGWITHHYAGAYIGRTLAGAQARAVEAEIEQRIVQAALGDPEAAKVLSGPVSKESIAAVERMVSSGAGMDQKKLQKETSPGRDPSPTGMHPKGVPMSAMERALDTVIPSAQAADAMDYREQKVYQDAVGAPINPRAEAQPQQRPDQGVAPIPAKAEQLAQLLVKTGRARDIGQARKMAADMTAGRR